MAEDAGKERQMLGKKGASAAEAGSAHPLDGTEVTDTEVGPAKFLTEQDESERQIRSIRVPGTIWAGTVPLVMLAILYGLALFADLPVPVMIAFAIGTFSSFIVIYSFILSGLCRITGRKSPDHPVSAAVRSASKEADE